MPELTINQVITLVGFGLSILTFFGGVWVGRRRQQRKLSRDQERLARRFTTVIGPVLSELRKKIDHLDRVEATAGEMRTYFRHEQPMLSEEERGLLAGLVEAGATLDQDCHYRWRGAIQNTIAADDMHEQGLNQVVVSAEEDFDIGTAAYRRTLVEAVRTVTDALDETRRFAADDTVSRIDHLMTTS